MGVAFEDELGERRVLTVPNALSLSRVLLLGAALALLFGWGWRVAAGAVLALAGGTDFLDGYVARRWHQVSRVGKVLDPTVDRIVLATTVVALIVKGAVPTWIGVVVLARETLVALATLALAIGGAARMDVIWLGKAATFGLLVALPLFLLGDGSGALAHGLHDAALAIALPALGASLVATALYVPRARQALAAGRRGRGVPLTGPARAR